MAPVEIHFNSNPDGEDAQKFTVKPGEKKAFHLRKPLHRAMEISCDADDSGFKVNAWALEPSVFWMGDSPDIDPQPELKIPRFEEHFGKARILVELGDSKTAEIWHQSNA